MKSLNFVAHEDDDLLFLNPDILSDDKRYIIYVTMGDDGRDSEYIYKRRMASNRAWLDYKGSSLHFFPLNSNSFRTGDIYGSLYKMWNDPEYIAIDDERYKWYRGFLLERLVQIIDSYKPDVIRTHDPDTEPSIDHDEPHLDHIDHIYTAKFVQEAAKAFPHIPVYAYMGYPIRYQPENVPPELAKKKLSMWRKYQEIDTSVAGEQWDLAAQRCYKRKIQ